MHKLLNNSFSNHLMTCLARLTLVCVICLTSCSEDDEELTPEERIVMRLHSEIMQKNDGWSQIQELCDDLGSRPAGSDNHNQAIDWALAFFKANGFTNIQKERVEVPIWTRGTESLTMIAPVRSKLDVTGIAFTANTPREGIESEIAIVDSKKQLDALGYQVKGKIVLFNIKASPYHDELGSNYNDLKPFQLNGAQWAGKYGASAVLVRSLTTRSLNTIQTGRVSYKSVTNQIPTASISAEAAEKIVRLAKRGHPVRVNLKILNSSKRTISSYNLYGDISGKEKSNEVVLLAGQLDTFDLGPDAHRSTAGAVIAMEAARSLKRLRQIPKRTVRVALFVSGLGGLAGTQTFANELQKDSESIVAAIEASSGAFQPKGFILDYHKSSVEAELLERCRSLTHHLRRIDLVGAKLGDLSGHIPTLKAMKIPLLSLDVRGGNFYNYQLTQSDTLDKVNKNMLSKCIATVACMTHLVADIPERLDHEIE